MDMIELANGTMVVGLRMREILVDVQLKTAEFRYETVSDAGEMLGAETYTCSLADWPKLDATIDNLVEKALQGVKQHARKKWGKKA